MFRSLLAATATLLLLSGCQKSTQQQAEAAVQDFVSNRASDPKNYFPDRFRFRPYTRRDSLLYLADMARITGTAAPPAPTAADSVRIGTLVRHTYRDETRDGVGIKDSGEYVVRLNGEVRELMAERVRKSRLPK
ncbi:hypothetical protein [Hymenobacter weizhouensis]|uniref:hypothetical protein n=1 Tax=Hymenobacter sp. YIM 151500-1 TaxID=2987689 RepID=UPI002226ECE4|nr:hypothetical protein [Hymenobacter sp. YIM 151500-1]UYZ65019.1 hypothetical protein OIS53_09235 [Hymenobacter sp. YIM 151500-1]